MSTDADKTDQGLERERHDAMLSAMERAISWLRVNREKVVLDSVFVAPYGTEVMVCLGVVYDMSYNWQRKLFAGRTADVGPGSLGNEDRVRIVDNEWGLIFQWVEKHPKGPENVEPVPVQL